MKKIYGLAALAAAMTLASCSNDNEPNVVPAGVETTIGYFKVNVKQAGAPTRAGHTTNIVGEDHENAFDKATFVFFDAEGNYKAIATDVDLKAPSSSTGNVEEKSTTVVKITRPAAAEGETPVANTDIKKVIAILNPTAAINTAVAGKSESAICGLPMADYSVYDTSDEAESEYKENGFVMTNAVYQSNTEVDGVKPIVYAQDCAGAIYEDEPSASAATAKDIFVERVVARVDGKVASDFGQYKAAVGGVGNGANIKINGVETQVSIKPIGYEVHNAALKSNLIKDVTGYSNFFSGWSDYTVNRSHWATTSLSSGDFATFKCSEIAVPTPANSTSGLKFTKYVQENTDQTNNPILLMTAQLVNSSDEPIELVRLMNNGLYYAPDDAKSVLVTLLNTKGYRKKAATEGEDPVELQASDFDWVADGSKDYTGYLGYAKDKDGTAVLTDADIVKEDGSAVTTFETSVLKVDCKAWKWDNGMCYFYTDIKNGNDASDKKGIVRNHIYEITMNSALGLGTPIFNPEKPIDPEKPEEPNIDNSSWYFNCTFNILSWVKYTQSVDFN